MSNTDLKSAFEFVYSNNELIRAGYRVNSAEAQPFVETILTEFPEESKYIFSNEKNHIGIANPYREAYNNEYISLYCFQTLPEELIEKYGLDTSTKIPRNYFGLKFDLTTKEVMVKYIFDDSSVKYFNFPNGCFYGSLHKPDKTVSDYLDLYVRNTSTQIITNFIQKHNLVLPISDLKFAENVLLWGFSYDTKKRIISNIKAYVLPSTN